MDKRQQFKDFYKMFRESGDCDTAYPCMNYIADRLELNKEQRYWLTLLYGCTYSAPTAYYILNEFPDFENVDENRLQRWWNDNKEKLLFQTDRAKVKNFDKFVAIFKSYKALIGNNTQEVVFKNIVGYDKTARYKNVYNFAINIYYFGRFSLFNYLEALHELTGLDIEPDTLDFKEAHSCRDGMLYVLDIYELNTEQVVERVGYAHLQQELLSLRSELSTEYPDLDVNFWNIETCLCAFKKLFWGKRYLGYYIDRQQDEISIMQHNVPEGVDWSILWDFRQEFFNPYWLGENNKWCGVRKMRLTQFKTTGSHFTYFETAPTLRFKYKVVFTTIGDVYE